MRGIVDLDEVVRVGRCGSINHFVEECQRFEPDASSWKPEQRYEQW